MFTFHSRVVSFKDFLTCKKIVSLQVLILDKNVYWNYRENWENR